MIYLRAGSSLVIEAKVSDLSTGAEVAYSPTSVQITLTDPTGTVIANLVPMTLSPATGHYTYYHRSTIFQPNGVYTALIKVTDVSDVYFIKTFVAFILTNGGVVDSFNYFQIKDSSNAVWYVSIVSTSIDSSDATLIVTSTVPTDAYLTAIDLTPTTVSYSLTITDELGGTVYLYIDTNGGVVLDTIQPAGATWTVSTALAVKARDRITYLLKGLSYLSFSLEPSIYPSI